MRKATESAAKRGVSLDFSVLAEAVRAELLKSGIYTMAESSKASKPKQETTDAIYPLLIKFNSAGDAVAMTVIFDWLHRLFMKAANEKYSGLRITAEGVEEAANV